MRGAILGGTTALIILLSTAPADAQFFPLINGGPRGPKTLMHWSGVEQPEEEEEANPRIITDRPHFAEAATTVGLGRVQIETGYTYFLDDNSGTEVTTHSYPETLLRLGVFREWFELRFAYNYLVEETVTTATRTRNRGFDDIYLGAKVALTKQAGYLPELTIFPQMKVPTGASAYTSSQVLPGMNFVYAWMLTEKLELEANTQVNRRRDDAFDHYYSEIFQTFNFEYDLCQKLMLFNEFVLVWPNGALSAQTQYYEHCGLHYFIMPNLQIDLHAGVGLNQAADNFFGGTGLSWRW
jgi:hypothetical protein